MRNSLKVCALLVVIVVILSLMKNFLDLNSLISTDNALGNYRKIRYNVQSQPVRYEQVPSLRQGENPVHNNHETH
jgi:hypothetical protein